MSLENIDCCVLIGGDFSMCCTGKNKLIVPVVNSGWMLAFLEVQIGLVFDMQVMS